MALGETTVTVVGMITSELEFERVGDEGQGLVTFCLRSNERRFDKAKGEWVDGRHLSVLVKCRRRLAQAVQPALRKGDPVLVTGRMSSSEYHNDAGQPRSLPEVEASAIGPNLMLCAAPIQRGKRPATSASERQVECQGQAPIDREVLVEVPEPVPVA